MVKGEKLRYHRIQRGLTQKKLAEGICDLTYVSKIENNKIEAPEQTLVDFCQRLNITLKELTEDIDEGYKRLLNEWYAQIKHKDENAATSKFTQLRVEFETVDDPFLLSHYHLFRLYYFLQIKDRKQCEDTLNNIKNLQNYITSEIEFDYYFILGLYEYQYGSLNKSKAYYTKAEKTAEMQKIEDPEFLYYMSLTLSRLQDVTHSTLYAFKALELYNQAMNFERCTDCHLLLGINFNHVKNYKTAEEYFQKVLNAADYNRKAKIIKGKTYHNLGNIYAKQGESKKSIEYLLKALTFKTEPGQKLNTLYLLTKEHYLTGDEGDAKEWLFKGLNHAEESSDQDYQIKFNLLKLQWLESKNSDLYRSKLEDAISFYKERDPDFAHECTELLAESYARSHFYKQAFEYLQSAKYIK
ncbi:helix-turn-helix domain-containing protein [Lentibacillus sediminis]|uniref:helix-turn-helix domain-containing protein n=1 Tax=Lentibacillus sediminis TaxID=1940529 RepID=UPI000C1BEDE7|nr:helix-turn-helix transcriptional regulator [Lentibacillus sediminis]